MAKSEKVEWNLALSKWSDVPTFRSNLDACSDALGDFAVMIEQGTGFWRDAWIAERYAVLSGADEVRLLHPLPFPDFAVRKAGVTRNFEATEAMRPGRRRGDEYRDGLERRCQGKSIARLHPESDWLTPQSAFEILKLRSENKAAKPYAKNCGLVIYLNESDYDTQSNKIASVFSEATEAAGRKFESVTVLWSNQLYQVW